MTGREREQLVLRFLGIESITGNEAAYTDAVEAELRTRGHEVRRQAVAPGRDNLVVGAGRPILFCTHLDTVPPFFPPSEDDTHLHGRGACDTKGILVAMLEAGDRLREEGIEVGYLLVVGEEVDGAGAERANRDLRADYVVVGEPTENQLALGHKGVLKFALESHGVTGHSAYPEVGHSAIHELTGVLAALLAEDWGHDDTLGPGTLNVGMVEGGHAANVIADRARAELMMRTVTPVQPILDRIRALLPEHTSLEVVAAKGPSHCRTVGGLPTTVVRFSTDIPYLPDVGEPLLYGPGSIRDAHTAHERIAKASLHRAVDDYVHIGRALAAGEVLP